MILESLYFFLPAYFANMAPVLFKWIPFLNKPVHSKLFGKNKTWRGLIIAPLIGTLIFWLQKYFHTQGFQALSLIDYADFSLLFGFLLGLGAILGDLVKSYYKRKNKIKEGRLWPLWDQLDFVLGALILSFLIYIPKADTIVVLVLLSPILHVVVNHLGYYLGIRKVKF